MEKTPVSAESGVLIVRERSPVADVVPPPLAAVANLDII
jgi:hypothetical protein